ncbi:MAG: response regulator [Roseiflexaceae bacterium]|nr:response regulator [Roseiflexaceae bacterium]
MTIVTQSQGSGMPINRAEDAYILLIEDDPNSYLIVEDLLKHAGFKHFYHRSSGAKVLSLIEALPQVDIILLDIGLPGEDGFAIIKKLRAHPRTTKAHIAAVTANIMHQTRLRAKDAGFDSFISKPIRPDQIVDQIRSMLRGHSFWW